MATAGSVAVALTAPFGGWLMDHIGPRRVMLVCLVLAGIGYFLLAGAQSLWQVVALFTIPLGVCYNWAILNSGAPILNNWFDRQKGRALALLNVGHGAGALLLPLMAMAIANLGWRTAMMISGVVLLAVGLPVVAVTRNTPEEMGLTPDGDLRKEEVHRQSAPLSGATLGQAVRTGFFWAMGLGNACLLFINISVIFHMVPILVWKGESQSVGANLLSLQLFLSVPIVLVSGWAADRVGGSKVLVAMMVATLAGVAVMVVAHDIWVYLLANALLAFGGSNWAILWAVLGQVYGRRHYNAIRMSIYSILILGMSGAPVLAGMTFDATHGYDLWLRLLLGVGVLGIALFVATVKTQSAARRLRDLVPA
jgi:MFS family permease